MWDRIWRTVETELGFLSRTSGRWWDRLDTHEQIILVSATCVTLLYLSLRHRRTAGYKNMIAYRDKQSNIVQFYGALVVIIIFSFGIDIAIERL